MNINAKQLTTFDITRMDITTALGFYGQIKAQMAANTTLTTAMGTVWTAFTQALQAFDDAYAQARKWAQTEDISSLDTLRDQALSAFLSALKAMLASPNAEKQQAAKLLTFIRDKYTLAASDEYMKETTAIQQMVQEMETTADAVTALSTTGLDDWLQDLKAKNEAFLQKMNERTDAQAGQQKGIVREKRLAMEAAYRNVVKLVNAMSICQQPADFDWNSVIDRLNAEIDHYRQILARKGYGSGSSSGGGGSDEGSSDDGGGSDDGGSDDGGDTPTPTPDPTPDPTPTPDPSGGGGDGGDE